jgi:hypothetical protein
MPRLYQTKGDLTKRYQFCIPMSIIMLNELRDYAEKQGRTPTAVARDFIENGIAAGIKKESGK